MQLGFRSDDTDFTLSMKGMVLGVLFGFSALLGFALSFTLLQPDGRPYLFTGCIVLFVLCLLFIDKKKEIALGAVLFILLRLVWSISVSGVRIW